VGDGKADQAHASGKNGLGGQVEPFQHRQHGLLITFGHGSRKGRHLDGNRGNGRGRVGQTLLQILTDESGPRGVDQSQQGRTVGEGRPDGLSQLLFGTKDEIVPIEIGGGDSRLAEIETLGIVQPLRNELTGKSVLGERTVKAPATRRPMEDHGGIGNPLEGQESTCEPVGLNCRAEARPITDHGAIPPWAAAA